jgi:hypothetical protein
MSLADPCVPTHVFAGAINTSTVDPLINHITYLSSLQRLSIDGSMDDNAFRLFAETAIPTITVLQALYIRGCNPRLLKPEGLAKALSNLPNLQLVAVSAEHFKGRRIERFQALLPLSVVLLH